MYLYDSADLGTVVASGGSKMGKELPSNRTYYVVVEGSSSIDTITGNLNMSCLSPLVNTIRCGGTKEVDTGYGDHELGHSAKEMRYQLNTVAAPTGVDQEYWFDLTKGNLSGDVRMFVYLDNGPSASSRFTKVTFLTASARSSSGTTAAVVSVLPSGKTY